MNIILPFCHFKFLQNFGIYFKTSKTFFCFDLLTETSAFLDILFQRVTILETSTFVSDGF